MSLGTWKGLAEQEAAFLCGVQKHPVGFFIATNSRLLQWEHPGTEAEATLNTQR